jgi:hypothetical protein
VDQYVLHVSCDYGEKIGAKPTASLSLAPAVGKEPDMPTVLDVSGTAALAICESLLLALNDRKIIPEHEIIGILKDAAAAHENVPDIDGSSDLHKAVAALIHRILAGGNSVRRH